MDLVRELRRFQQSRHLVRIRRTTVNGTWTDGFVLGLSDELVAMAAIVDFRPDGLEIFPIARVTKVETQQRDVFWQTMLERDGLVPAGGVHPRLQIGDYRALGESLAKWGKAVGVSYLDEDGTEFLYGPGIVRGADAKGLSLLYFDSSGAWDDEPTNIPYERILCVDVDRPYVNTFERHMAPPEIDLDPGEED